MRDVLWAAAFFVPFFVAACVALAATLMEK